MACGSVKKTTDTMRDKSSHMLIFFSQEIAKLCIVLKHGCVCDGLACFMVIKHKFLVTC